MQGNRSCETKHLGDAQSMDDLQCLGFRAPLRQPVLWELQSYENARRQFPPSPPRVGSAVPLFQVALAKQCQLI